MTNRNNILIKFLEAEGFIQYVKEATHIKGRLIDHFYLRPSMNPVNISSINRYSPYYSDHDAICATIETYAIPDLSTDTDIDDLVGSIMKV